MSETKIPGGSWINSAKNYSMTGTTLNAQLENEEGGYDNASVQVIPGATYENIDGKFVLSSKEETKTTLSPEEIYHQLSQETPPNPLFPDATETDYSKLSAKDKSICENAYTDYEKQLEKATKLINEEENLEKGMNILQNSLQVSLNSSMNCVSNTIFSEIQENINDVQAMIFNISNVSADKIKQCSSQTITQKNAVVNYTSSKVENNVINSIKNTQNNLQKISNDYFEKNPNLKGTPIQSAIQFLNNSSANLNYNDIYKTAISKNIVVQGNKINVVDVHVKGTLNLCKNNQKIIQNITIKNVVNSFVKNIFKNKYNNNQALTFSLGEDNEEQLLFLIFYILITVILFLASLYFLECYKKTLGEALQHKKYLHYFIFMFIFSIIGGLSCWFLYYFLDKSYLLLCIICSSIVGFFFILCLCIRYSKKLKQLEEGIIYRVHKLI